MRGILVESLDGPRAARLADLPEPSGAHPRAGGERLLIDVHAAGLSFIDPLQSWGKYQNGVPVPYTAGSEFAGVVLEAPEGGRFAVGDRVAGITWQGALAERCLAVPDFTVKVPDDMSWTKAAALYMNYATAWYAYDRARVEAGEFVLVQGAAGGVGTAALDLAASFGARAVALVSSPEKEEVCRALGAEIIVRVSSEWLSDVRAATEGRGVHVVLDTVGGDRFTDSLRSLRQGGRLVVIGFAGGDIPTVKVNRLLHGNLTVTGITMDNMETEYPGTLALVATAIEGLAAEGAIDPPIGRVWTLDQAPEAMASMAERSAVGKVVVSIKE
jgi:NADPH2:quinone reductase